MYAGGFVTRQRIPSKNRIALDAELADLPKDFVCHLCDGLSFILQ